MRYLQLTLAVAVLVSTAWAQSARQRREFKRLPEVEALMRSAKWERLEEMAPSRPTQQLRTAALPPLAWLKPSQDADTVPDVPSTRPNFAHDTLLANNAGQDIDPTTDSTCHHSFFDNLYSTGAWLIFNPNQNGATYFGNYLHPPSDLTPDTLYYVGGGIAERYDIDPCTLAGSGKSLYIKGIASQILNNFFSRSTDWNRTCTPVMGEVTQPFVNDTAYTIFYQLLDTFMLDIDWDNTGQPIPTSFPGDTLAQVYKKLSQVRIGYPQSLGQCVTQQFSRLERYDHAYFTTPVEIDKRQSVYAAIRYELYTPGLDNLEDTLFGLIGPAYDTTHPCRTRETMVYGRNAVLVPAFGQTAGEWIFAEWYPQYFFFGYDLNFLLHPIIYEAPGTSGGVTSANCSGTTGQVVRSGSQGFGLPYPNPAVECINLTLTTPAATRGSFTLYTVDGQKVMEWTRPVPAGESTVALDLPAVPAGSYILHARTPYGLASFWVNVVK